MKVAPKLMSLMRTVIPFPRLAIMLAIWTMKVTNALRKLSRLVPIVPRPIQPPIRFSPVMKMVYMKAA